MCIPAAMGALGFGGGAAAGATAAGATAGAATIGSTLQTIGTIASVVGNIGRGIAVKKAADEQAAFLDQQAKDELRLAAIEDERLRGKFRAEMAKQRAQLAGSGVSLDSPTAILLGDVAAREMSFDSQARRSGGQARSNELTSSARASRARGALGLLKGSFSAASTIFEAAPDLWPGLMGDGETVA